MRHIRQNYISLIIIFILSTIPLLWFKDNCLIAGGDNNQYMSTLKLVKNYSYYLTEENMGQYNLGQNSITPSIGIFWWLFKSIGLEDHIIQRLWFISIWFFSMWGMYLLIKEIAKENFSRIGGILGACLYMINIFNGQLALSLAIGLTFLALPYLMLATIRAITDRRKENLYVLCFGIVILFVCSVLPNPGYSYILFLLPVLYILLSGRPKLIVKTFLASFISISFFALPYLYGIRNLVAAAQPAAHKGFFSANSIQEAFRFLASWAFRAGHYKIPYNPWADKYYNSPWVVFATFIVPIMVFIGFVFQKRFKKDIFFFCLIAILGLFLSKGIGRPLGDIYQWAFDHIPLFTAFRESWSKFTQMTVFSFSILLGLGFCEIKKNIYKTTFSAITVCAIAVSAFPIFTSSIFSTYWNGSMKGNYIKIPDYWIKTREYLKKQGVLDIIFLTPRSQLSVYEWDRGVSTMASVPSVLLDNSVIKYEDHPAIQGREMLHLVYSLIEPENSYKFSKLLKLLGVRYILQQNDTDWRFLAPYTYSPIIMEKIFKKQPGLRRKRSIGKLDIYEVSKEYYLPEIYIADNISSVYGDIKDLPKLSFTDSLDKKPLINLTDKETKNTILIYNLESEKPTIDIPEGGEYTIKLAYEPLQQKEIIATDISQLNFMDLGKAIPVFSTSPILANWEYETLFYQPQDKILVVENFNDKTVNIDLCIRFENYWKGIVRLFDWDTSRLVKEDSIYPPTFPRSIGLRGKDSKTPFIPAARLRGIREGGGINDFNDFIQIRNISVIPGKNIFKLICTPAKCEKNWPGEKVNVKRDVGIKLSDSHEPLSKTNDKSPHLPTEYWTPREGFENSLHPRSKTAGFSGRWGDKLILETDYNLTIFNGIKQIDLLCYLDSNNDKEVDGWMQVTMDDWLMARDYSHFRIDLIEAMKERLNNIGYKILAINMLCYPTRGGGIDKIVEPIEGDVLLRDFSITHMYYLNYLTYSTYLKNNLATLCPFRYSSYTELSDKYCYPIVIEVKDITLQGGKTKINKPRDETLDLKWLMLIPKCEVKESNGIVKDIKKINPVLYKTKIDIKEPCYIVFSKNFHKDWNLFIGKKKINNHIKVNGYANAWYLELDEIEQLKKNNSEITFAYYPQIYQDIGAVITLLFLVGTLIYAVKNIIT